MATRTDPDRTRGATVNLRLQAGARDLIDRAAAVSGKSRTEFMVEAARREAEEVLLDRCFFGLGDKSIAKFLEALNRRPPSNARLRRLLRKAAPWD